MKNNKLIAEFMGANIDELPRNIYDRCYHTSWDWLIPVVKKCVFETKLSTVDGENLASAIQSALLNCEINQLQKCVTEFIQWYNQYK